MAVAGVESAGNGPSRGGQTAKIQVLTDLMGCPAVLRLTAGNVSDIRFVDELGALPDSSLRSDLPREQH
jgi:hypothetical protein